MTLDLKSSFCSTVHRPPASPVSALSSQGQITGIHREAPTQQRYRETETGRGRKRDRHAKKITRRFSKERQKYIQSKAGRQRRKDTQTETQKQRWGVEGWRETGTGTEIREAEKESGRKSRKIKPKGQRLHPAPAKG